MLPRRKCELCGNPVNPDLVRSRKRANKSIICRDCVTKEREAERAQRLVNKKALFATRRCVVCGRAIDWKDLYDKKSVQYWPTTCSTHCHGILSKQDALLSKEQAEARIMAFLSQVGHPCTYSEVMHGCHMASKVACRLGISVLDIQKRMFGLDVERVRVGTEPPSVASISLADVCSKYGLHCNSFAEVLPAVAAKRKVDGFIDKLLVEDLMKAYICSCGHFVNKTAFYHEVFLGKDTYWPIIKELDSVALNTLFGYRDPKRSWYETRTRAILHDLFGVKAVSSEHTFVDCRSMKNFPLRFDFFVPTFRLLIEVDGAQHSDKTNGYYKDELVDNDSIKTRYALEHGYTLLRIATTPRFTFTARLHKALMGVIKPVELLEPRPGNAEGNQQPSLEQDEFDF